MNPFIATPSQRPAVIAEVEKRLAANPRIAAEFDELNKKSRREKIVACLDYIAAAKAENVTLRANLTARKQKLAALEKAMAASAPARLFTSSPKAVSKPAQVAPKPAAPAPAARRKWCNPPPTAAAPKPLSGYDRTRNAFAKKAN